MMRLCVIIALIVIPSFVQVHSLTDPRLLAVGNRTAAELFIEDRDILNLFLYQEGIVTADTPILVRYLLLIVCTAYDTVAACQPQALSFLGTKDSILPTLCSPARLPEVILLLSYHVLRPEFPEDAKSLGILLDYLGLDLSEKASDEGTPAGWAVKHGQRLKAYFAQDGWNSRGNSADTPYTHRFADSTGYKPKNLAESPEEKLLFPLRWQPATRDMGRGSFSSQVHVVPHIGLKAMPLALTDEDLSSRHTDAPYTFPNVPLLITPFDVLKVNTLVDEAVQFAKNVTYQQRALAVWWDIKLASSGTIVLNYARSLQLPLDRQLAFFLGDMIAQHDAAIVAWREKRRHDLVRPQTLVRRQRGGSSESVFVRQTDSVQEVNLSEYESFLPPQPHSEFPSASAALCAATFEHARLFGDANRGSNPFPVFTGPVERSIFNPRGLFPPTTVTFNTPEEAALSCGISRLWAGVHFRPAVEAGFKVGEGIGQAAFKHVSDLVAGRRPEVCSRCGRF